VSRDCCTTDYDALFDDRAARRELKAYRRQGADGSTRTLLDAIRAQGVEGAALLDIGGGVGVIGAELLDAGALSLTDVDASGPYLAAARSEIERRGFGDRASFLHGDFVQLASSIEAADVVTLDRVVCCYDDWEALVGRSVERARRLYGLVLPRDRWWMRTTARVMRRVGRLFGQACPFDVHPERQIDARIRAAGLELVFAKRGLAWQTLLYRRTA
jgi:hypothetical protein